MMIDFEEEALVCRSVGRRLVNDFVVETLPLARRPVGQSMIVQSIFQWEQGSVGRSIGLPFNERVRMLDQSVGWSVVEIPS